MTGRGGEPVHWGEYRLRLVSRRDAPGRLEQALVVELDHDLDAVGRLVGVEEDQLADLRPVAAENVRTAREPREATDTYAPEDGPARMAASHGGESGFGAKVTSADRRQKSAPITDRTVCPV